MNEHSGTDGDTNTVRTILRDGLRQRVFSAAAWSYGTKDRVLGSGTIGTLSWDGAPAQANSWWDLASVTKPVVGIAVMALVEAGALVLEDTIGDWLPALRDTDKATRTLRHLLTHTSGIPGQVPLYRWCDTAEQFVDAIRYIPVAFAPNTNVAYSSLGFVLLGLIAEKASGLPLEELLAQRVTNPAGMTATRFGLPPELRHQAVATEDCPWRGRIVQGTVHDENAEVLGGIAGLFAPLGDLVALGTALCRGGAGSHGRLLSPAGLAAMIEPATDHLPLRRSLAWQGRDRANCPAGDLLGPRAYGHNGFTGTSLWIDPDRGCYVILLTNRVHPSRAGQEFVRIRKAVHNSAMRTISTTID